MIEMTITEGLKKLNLIQKRIEKNCEEIQKYASLLSNERPIFETERHQREEISKLIQSNLDLEKEYNKIKAMIDYTNLVTYVQINDENRSIHSWLIVLRKTGKTLIQTYKSLNPYEATSKLLRFKNDTNSQITVIRLYDENEKRNGERKWEDLTSGKTIEGRLEVINATTKLISPPVV